MCRLGKGVVLELLTIGSSELQGVWARPFVTSSGDDEDVWVDCRWQDLFATNYLEARPGLVPVRGAGCG